jgi:hypothetical protein
VGAMMAGMKGEDYKKAAAAGKEARRG